MEISQIFNLNKSQAELDFVNINILEDAPLFIDPFFLSKRTDRWSIEANRTLQSFFQRVLDLIRANDLVEARELFDHFMEPNETCLGLSKGTPRGRGMGRSYSDEIFDQLSRSRAVQSGLIQDIQDNVIFVKGYGKDRLSDMATVLLKKHLIQYTQQQCRYHNIPMTSNLSTGYYWDSVTRQWEQDVTDLLIANGKHIILVPKGIVSFSKTYTAERFYYHYVLNFHQHEYIRLNHALIQRRANGSPYITKKVLQDIIPRNKDFLREFAEANREVFTNFKQREKTESLNNTDFSQINIRDIKTRLISVLNSISTSRDDADRYHKHIKSVLEFLFYPILTTPILENEIHEGRKRIDITFDNAANNGIFHSLSHQYALPCPYIMVECKNYTADPANPELDQLGGRFSLNRGKVGLLLCRSFSNIELFLNRCKDTYRDGRGLIVPLVDENLIDLINNYDENNYSYLDNFLKNRIREITFN